jgi:hypothetical protein
MATSDIAMVQPFLELLQILDDTGKNEQLNIMRDRCNAMVRNALGALGDNQVDITGDTFW